MRCRDYENRGLNLDDDLGRMRLLELQFPSLSRAVATASLRGANAASGPQGEKRRLVDFVASLHGRAHTRPPLQLRLRQALRLPVEVTVPAHLAALEPTVLLAREELNQQAPVPPPTRRATISASA